MKLLREPLVHFLAIGALLFVLHGIIGEQEERQDEIVVTTGKVDHLIELWIQTRQRPPTQIELTGVIDDYVIEEILYREAKALGLDEDDTIIRRRLRQKMEFIARDVAETVEPSDAELQQYLKDYPSAFQVDALVAFEHVFFNVDIRGGTAFDDAVLARDRLNSGEVRDPLTLGDGFPIPSRIESLSTRDVSAMFGPDFATELLTLPAGEWSGPIPSGFGLHVVRISAYDQGREPVLDEVRDAVVRDWSSERGRKVRDQMYASFREHYKVIIETPDSDSDDDSDHEAASSIEAP